jgi:Superinfection immunity protein
MRPGFLAACAVYLVVGLALAWFAGANMSGAAGGMVGAAILFALYFLPAIVAAWRHHSSVNAIATLNLFLGWTLIGWVAALVWALAGPPQVTPAADADDRRPCPHCAEAIWPLARVCHFCRHELAPGWAVSADVVTLPSSGGRPRPTAMPRPR